ncbi:MAG TPA: SDR family oxidoreductase [Gemmatimonadales bacterium]|nr:SDR family oxidoreductase [Gemmatimonadales bacterium]
MGSVRPVALVTAAGRGIGAACARALSEAGYGVAVMSRGTEAEVLAGELDGIGVRGDVTRPGDLASLVKSALHRWGRIDGVVISTGHPPKGELLALTDDDWQAGADLLLLNVIRLARLVTPVMEGQGGGAIVNVSSLVAEEPDARFPVSSVHRAGLGAFTKLYADRYARAGIRMNTVLPGYVENYEVDEATRKAIPLGRPATLAEVAATVRFLLSDEAGAITGQQIRVDGGLGRGV